MLWPNQPLYLGALRNWLGGGRGLSPSVVIEPQSCLMTCFFYTVSIVMLNQDTSVPGVPVGLVGGAISGSRAAVLQLASFHKTKMLFKAKLDSLVKER